MKLIRLVIFLSLVFQAPLGAAVGLSASNAAKVQQAMALQQQQKFDAAIHLLLQLKSNRPYDKAYIHGLLAHLYWQKGQLQKAEQALSTSLSLAALPDEQDREMRRMYADILLSNGKESQAISQYGKLLSALDRVEKGALTQKQTKALIAQRLPIYYRLAQAHYQLQHWKELLAYLQSYQKVKPLDLVGLQMQQGAQLALEHWQAALSTTEGLRALEPHNGHYWQQRFTLLMKLKLFNEALAHLKQYQRLGFSLSQQELRTLAYLYAKQGYPEAAALIYQNDLLDKSARDWSQQAHYWQQAKVWQRSLEAWKQAAAFDKLYLSSYLHLLMQEKHYDRVLQVIEQESVKRQAFVLVEIEALYRLERIQEARALALRAYQTQPTVALKNWLEFFLSKQG